MGRRIVVQPDGEQRCHPDQEPLLLRLRPCGDLKRVAVQLAVPHQLQGEEAGLLEAGVAD
eukprot:CAMPEP_0179139918 /NCGR_PEP_ID=MMETSP0796-20121207/66959_1 /TAXON_ID=73915 /ORGANISM="Pyrodinium bahamense, Strain pbaha01" /LENGTH=59 /DNA_ID=CAMNT_0020839407 /DNA_START=502 /DNA_END=678 /DNA_ORIENTATION=-